MRDDVWRDNFYFNRSESTEIIRRNKFVSVWNDKWVGSPDQDDTFVCFRCGCIKPIYDFVPTGKTAGSKPTTNCVSCRGARDGYEKGEKRKNVKAKRKAEDPEGYQQKQLEYSRASDARKRAENEEEYLASKREKAQKNRYAKKSTTSSSSSSDSTCDNFSYTPYQKESYYRTCASSKGIPVTITSEQFEAIFKSECFYCGSPPTTESLMGVDRLSTCYGYCVGNVVPCCTMCNMMKGSFDPTTFINKAHEVSFTYHEKQSEGELVDDPVEVSAVSYNEYSTRASKKGLEFMLSKEEYDDIVSRPCYYCFSTTSIGLDRIDSSKGYMASNIYPACSLCNYMKRDYPLMDFYMKCDKIAEHTKDMPYYDWFEKFPTCYDNISFVASCSTFSLSPHDGFSGYFDTLPTHTVLHLCAYSSCKNMIVSGHMCDTCADRKEKSYSEIAVYMEGRNKCSAMTKTGKSCNFYAITGEELCERHKNPSAYQQKQRDVSNQCIAAVSNKNTRCTKMVVKDSEFCVYHKKQNPTIVFLKDDSTDQEKREHSTYIHDKFKAWLKEERVCDAYSVEKKVGCDRNCIYGFDVCSYHIQFSGMIDKRSACIEHYNIKNRNRVKKHASSKK